MLSDFSKTPIHCAFAQGNAETKLITSENFLRFNPHVRLILPGTNINLAIISRNANVKEAAREIVQANYDYGTSPPAAPSFIFVDEFVLQDFVAHLQHTARDTQARQQSRRKLRSELDFDTSNSWTAEFRRQGGKQIELGDGKAILIGSPEWKSMRPYESTLNIKRSNPESSSFLCLVPTTSLEGAISFAAQLSPDGNATSTLFVFAGKSEAGYLSVFVPSATTYINHIPLHALFTPPPHLPVESTLKNIFSRPHPVFADPSSQMISISAHIFQQPVDSLIRSLASVLAVQKLDPPKQKSGKQVGFFAQGGLVGLSHLLFGLAVTGAGMMYLITWARSKLPRLLVHS